MRITREDYTVIIAPKHALVKIVSMPTISADDGSDMDWAAEFPDTAAPTAFVAMVYSEPANEVTSPPAPVASVIASPPAEVTTVTACPPTAEKAMSMGMSFAETHVQVTVSKTPLAPEAIWVPTDAAPPPTSVATDTTSEVIVLKMLSTGK